MLKRGSLCLLVYIFPIIVFVWQLKTEYSFVKSNWFIYIIGLGLLIYSHIRYFEGKKDRSSDSSVYIRRFYFTYALFSFIVIMPNLDTLDFFTANKGIFGLSKNISTCLILLIFAFIVYLIIISDSQILEVSIGKTKVTMVKEKYKAEIDNHINISEILMEKISSEHRAIQNMGEYCLSVGKRIQEEDEINTVQEYQILLENYFKDQREHIKVTVLDEINSAVKKDYNLTSGELEELKYRIKSNETCNIKKADIYYLFFPFSYKFENIDDPVCIVLYSETPIIIDVETKIIPNILVKFTDDFLNLVTIDNNG